MILSNSMRIYSCKHKNAIKKLQKKKYKGFPVFLCDKCKKELTE